MSKATIYTWDDVPGEPAKGAVRRDIHGDGAWLRMVSIEAGTVAGRHSHPHEQFVHVLSGTGTLECEAGTVPLRPGTVLHFATDAWHSAVFETATVLVEVNVSPPA